MKQSGKNPAEYELVMDLDNSMILHSKVTGEYEVMDKT